MKKGVTIATAPPPAPKILPLKRTLEVRFVEMNRLGDIDIINQRFHAEFVVQLAFKGGANDEQLSSTDPGFPLDAWNRPTFRPSAAWYMAQVDFNNAHEFTQLDAKVVTDGDDLLMNMRFEGVFSEISKPALRLTCTPLHPHIRASSCRSCLPWLRSQWNWKISRLMCKISQFPWPSTRAPKA